MLKSFDLSLCHIENKVVVSKVCLKISVTFSSSHLNYASSVNISRIKKFFKKGDRTSETDFQAVLCKKKRFP